MKRSTTFAQAAQTASAAAGFTAGQAAAYASWLPSYRAAAQAYMNLPPEVREYIRGRAAKYGMDPVEVLRKVPRALWESPEGIETFMRAHDISHIKATKHQP